MLLVVYLGFVGLLVGSAINAIVWRLYVGRSWVLGRSMCPECKHELRARDLVPVLSWLALGGKCRYCRARIHWQYPVVELLTAALFAGSTVVLGAMGFGGTVELGLWLLLLSMMIILAVYDLRWMILPDKVMLPAIVVASLLAATRAFEVHSWLALRGPIAAAIAAAGFFYGIAAITRGRAMGGGDIKFVFMMGLVLGLGGTLLGLLIAFDAAAVIAIILLALRRRGRRDMIPFGPFLVGATIFANLLGGSVIKWYLQVNGLS